MKKRLLVIMALGLSFAPPVFAENDKGTGERKVSQTPSAAIKCAFADRKVLPADRAPVIKADRAKEAGNASVN